MLTSNRHSISKSRSEDNTQSEPYDTQSGSKNQEVQEQMKQFFENGSDDEVNSDGETFRKIKFYPFSKTTHKKIIYQGGLMKKAASNRCKDKFGVSTFSERLLDNFFFIMIFHKRKKKNLSHSE